MNLRINNEFAVDKYQVTIQELNARQPTFFFKAEKLENVSSRYRGYSRDTPESRNNYISDIGIKQFKSHSPSRVDFSLQTNKLYI